MECSALCLGICGRRPWRLCCLCAVEGHGCPCGEVRLHYRQHWAQTIEPLDVARGVLDIRAKADIAECVHSPPAVHANKEQEGCMFNLHLFKVSVGGARHVQRGARHRPEHVRPRCPLSAGYTRRERASERGGFTQEYRWTGEWYRQSIAQTTLGRQTPRSQRTHIPLASIQMRRVRERECELGGTDERSGHVRQMPLADVWDPSAHSDNHCGCTRDPTRRREVQPGHRPLVFKMADVHTRVVLEK